jgi:hypothetical protein
VLAQAGDRDRNLAENAEQRLVADGGDRFVPSSGLQRAREVAEISDADTEGTLEGSCLRTTDLGYCG